jgi:adenylate kinase
MALNLVMLGPPGAGKGTQAKTLAAARGIPHISTGDMLREAVAAGTEIGLRAKAVMAQGQLVSDEIIVGVVRERLAKPDAAAGFLLDGFPRTVPQARALDGVMEGRGALVVVDIAVSDEELIRRLTSRRVCGQCGTNADVPAPGQPVPTSCGKCGGALTQRADDREDVIRERLRVYARDTRPLLDYYHGRPTFRSVNGAQGPSAVGRDLAAAVDEAQAASALRQAQGAVSPTNRGAA